MKFQLTKNDIKLILEQKRIVLEESDLEEITIYANNLIHNALSHFGLLLEIIELKSKKRKEQ